MTQPKRERDALKWFWPIFKLGILILRASFRSQRKNNLKYFTIHLTYSKDLIQKNSIAPTERERICYIKVGNTNITEFTAFDLVSYFSKITVSVRLLWMLKYCHRKFLFLWKQSVISHKIALNFPEQNNLNSFKTLRFS